MRHHNSVFHDLVKRIPWGAFDKLVAAHGADHRVRKLSAKSQLIALLYGQLSGSVSLREISGGLESHRAGLYHLGARCVQRTTLADANAKRSSCVFTGLFASMVAMAGRGARRAMGEALYLIDSTSVPLSGMGTQWAYFSHKACGAKVHVVYDANAERPVYAAVTPARINDITAAKAMPITPGATYVFDLGYYDHQWWADLDDAGCRIVTRFKTNTTLRQPRTRPVEPQGPVLSDREGFLSKRVGLGRANPFTKPVREVCVKLETGKVLRILTNDLNAPAAEIAALYKSRWAIELFFRWIKQTLKIKHFLGRSENAARIQVAVALIAYLLLHMAKADQSAIPSLLDFTRLVRTNLMHKKRIDNLKPKPEPPRQTDQYQLSLQWT